MPSKPPSSSADRMRLKVGFVLLVGLSGGMIALQGDASPLVIGLTTLGALVAGGVLLWYLTWIGG